MAIRNFRFEISDFRSALFFTGVSKIIEKAIYSLLSANATLTGEVSTRIYPILREQSAGLPAVTFQIISTPRLHCFGGPTGMVTARVQINCFADDPLEAAEISEIVRKSYDGYSGSPADIRIEAMLLEDIGDLPVINAGSEEANVFAKTMDFQIYYKE